MEGREVREGGNVQIGNSVAGLVAVGAYVF